MLGQTRIQKIGYKDYEDYLSSPLWKARRESFSLAFSEKCYVCRSENDCCLHHITYERVGAELNSDLIWLCREHHQKIHQVIDGKATIPVPKRRAHIKMREQFVSPPKKPIASPTVHKSKKSRNGMMPSEGQLSTLRRLGISEDRIQKLKTAFDAKSLLRSLNPQQKHKLGKRAGKRLHKKCEIERSKQMAIKMTEERQKYGIDLDNRQKHIKEKRKWERLITSPFKIQHLKREKVELKPEWMVD